MPAYFLRKLRRGPSRFGSGPSKNGKGPSRFGNGPSRNLSQPYDLIHIVWYIDLLETNKRLLRDLASAFALWITFAK